MESHINIRVKTIDNKITDFQLNLQKKVIDLKQAIQEKLNIPVEKQRLIYQGRLMENADTFSKIKFENGFVVHLIAQQQQIQASDEQQQTLEQEAESSGLNTDLEFLRGILRAIRQTSEQRQNLRRFMMQQRTNGFNIQFEDSSEILFQNLSNIKQMINCSLNIQELNQRELQNETFINPFKFHKRKLLIGQWVDVQDTIDQWVLYYLENSIQLEAQVMDEKDGKVFIHYNGWGNRWDEWIDMDSPRIALFRTYTLPSLNQDYLSPSPQNDPDGDLNLRQSPIEFPELIDEMGYVMSYVTNMLIKLRRIMSQQIVSEKQQQIKTSLRNQEEIKVNHEFEESKESISDSQEMENLKTKVSLISSQISPIFDRLGRMMVDLAPHFAAFGQETQRISNQQGSRFAFQVPLILTPRELHQTQIQSPEFSVLFSQNQRQEQQQSQRNDRYQQQQQQQTQSQENYENSNNQSSNLTYTSDSDNQNK